MLRPAPLCLGDRNPESGGWSLFRFGQFFGRKGTDRKGAQEGGSLPWQKNPPTAESKESDGEQREGDVCQGNGFGRVRSALSAAFERGARAGIRRECLKDARNGALELTKRRGRVILCPRVRKRLYGRLNASARVWVSVAEAKREVFRRCQTVSSAIVRLRSVRQCPKEGRNRPAMPFSLSANPIPLPGALKRS